MRSSALSALHLLASISSWTCSLLFSGKAALSARLYQERQDHRQLVVCCYRHVHRALIPSNATWPSVVAPTLATIPGGRFSRAWHLWSGPDFHSGTKIMSGFSARTQCVGVILDADILQFWLQLWMLMVWQCPSKTNSSVTMCVTLHTFPPEGLSLFHLDGYGTSLRDSLVIWQLPLATAWLLDWKKYPVAEHWGASPKKGENC